MTEQFYNNASTSLTSSITSAATTFNVFLATVFPTPNFRIMVDQEIMLVTGVSGNQLTVTRGVENTVAAGHNANAVVTHIVTAGGLNQFRADTISVGSAASLPSAGVGGRLYIPTDNIVMYHDNGTTWDTFGPIRPCTLPPSTGWTWVNQASLATASGGLTTPLVLNITSPNTTGTNVRMYTRPLINSHYTITMGFIPSLFANNYPGGGLYLYENSNGQLVSFQVQLSAGTTNKIFVVQTTGTTGSSSVVMNYNAPFAVSGCRFSSASRITAPTDSTSTAAMELIGSNTTPKRLGHI